MRVLIQPAFVAFGFGLALCAAELLLRLFGGTAEVTAVPYDPSKFAFTAPFAENSAAGWQLRPGNYLLLQGGRGKAINVSINPDASRATRTEEIAPVGVTSKIVFIGDSYVFGEGLDDEETLPWRLQELLPKTIVINHGVGGYGTCQALCRLAQLKEFLSNGDTVVYGLSAFHEERNIADPRLDYWLAISSPIHESGYSRCKVINGEIVRENPKVWETAVPLTGSSVLSKILTNAWLSFLAAPDKEQQRQLTYSLILKMQNLSTDRGASLVVLLQDLPPDAASDYRHFLSRSDISYVDGTGGTALPDLKLPDGHPGPQMTKMWAKQLAAFLNVKDNGRLRGI